jgi:hypothetical protein
MKKYIIVTLIICAFCQHINAQKTFAAPASVKANPAMQNKELAVKKIPPIWGARPNGLRIEIRIANSVFVQSDQTFRESQRVFGNYLSVNDYHQPQQGQVAGYYDVAPVSEETLLSFSRSGSYQSVKTEDDYTVYRITQYGDVPQNQLLGYNINLADHINRSVFKTGLKITGNTALNGTAVNPSVLGGKPIVLTISQNTVK